MAGRRDLFVTLDRLGGRHSAASLEAAYAGAAALAAFGLDFVLAPRPTVGGRFTVPLADGALSCTPWSAGPGGPDLAAGLRRRLAEPWRTGPYGEPARAVLTTRLTARGWSPTASRTPATSCAPRTASGWSTGRP